MMGRRLVSVDLPKDRGPMMDHPVAPTEERIARAHNLTCKRQFRPWQNTDRHARIFRCHEPPGAGVKVVGDKLIANFRRPRFDVVKAEVTHRSTPRLTPAGRETTPFWAFTPSTRRLCPASLIHSRCDEAWPDASRQALQSACGLEHRCGRIGAQ